MKKIKLILMLIVPVLMDKGFAQVDTLFWETGKYSLLAELGKVWIIKHKGSTIKNVKIQNIDTATGKLIYLSEGTLHDVFISNIRMISPGKYYNDCIVFKRKLPVIKSYPESPGYDAGSFRSHNVIRPEKAVNMLPTENKNEIVPKKQNSNDIAAGANARIVFGNGKQIHVKLLEIGSNEVSYKRADLLDGPLYVIKLNIPGTLKFAKVTEENGITTIDYTK